MLNLKFSKEQKNAAEDVPTEQSPPRKDTWIQIEDEDTWWTARAEGEKK
jgi:hypothetical protein